MKGKIAQVYAVLFAGLIFMFLGCRYNYFGKLPLWAVCLEILLMISALVLLFLPSYFLHKATGGDVFTAFNKASVGRIAISSLYALLFVFVCVRFISIYVEILTTALNPDANKYVLAGGLLLVCAYSAHKGIFTSTRCALICSAVIAFCVIMVLASNISEVELNNLYRSNRTDSFFSGAFSILSVCFLPVIFSLISDDFSHSKALFISFIIISFFSAALLIFFVNTVLGNYGDNRKFPYFILSKNASFGQMASFDFLYMIAISLCTFVIVAVILCCINKAVAVEQKGKNTVTFTILIFVLYICTEALPKAKSLIQNDVVLAVMCVLYALIIPLYTLIKLKGGNKNA